MTKILVLEDQEDSFQVMKRGIDSSYDVVWAKTVQEAKDSISMGFDLMIVDVGLPDGDGFEFCGWVRQLPNYQDMPIMFVSAKDSVESKVTGLSVGGDDYISKPFHLMELRARIESKLRSRKAQKNKDMFLEYEGVSINLKSRRVFIKENNQAKEIELTPIEFKILLYLIEDPGKACGRDDILNKVWGDNIYVYPRSVDTHVSKLRKKLGHKSNLVHSVHGTGYRLGTA